MKRTVMISLMLVLVAALIAAPIMAKGGNTCTTIKEGTLLASNGDLLVLGYDEFGYNYQAYMFNGRYCDYDRDPGGAYCDVELVMKWNDAWLSNKDCDGDGKLDRHRGYASYIGSGAWCTNHQWGYNEDGTKWVYFVKIVAVPGDAYRIGGSNTGTWYTTDDVEIGPDIWGAFAIIQQVYNDKGTGDHGILYKSPASPGFGPYKP